MDVTTFISAMMADNLYSPNRYSVTIGGSSLISSITNIVGATVPNAAPIISNAVNLGTSLGLLPSSSMSPPDAQPDVVINCASFSIPSIDITTLQDRRYGVGTNYTFPDGRELHPATATFYNSNSHKERQFFKNWIDGVYDQQNRQFNYLTNYQKTVTITSYNKADIPVYIVKLSGAYPVHVSELNRAYASQSTLDIFSVQLVYQAISETFPLSASSNPIAAGINLAKSITTATGNIPGNNGSLLSSVEKLI